MEPRDLVMLAGVFVGSTVGGFFGAKARELAQNRNIHKLHRRVFGTNAPDLPVPQDTPVPAPIPCVHNGASC